MDFNDLTCGRICQYCYVTPITQPPFPSLSPSLSLPLLLSPSLHFLQPAWFLMVGGDRSFKLALTEKDEEFSDELRKDCEVKGDGQRESKRGREGVKREGRGGEGGEGEGDSYQ